MEITEVRVRLVAGGAERLRAFCSITLDGDFVIRDLKVIEGVNGYFVAMPSRKLAHRCGKCGAKNHLRARFCNECGAKLGEKRAPKDAGGRVKLHVDVAHPINTACRERIQQIVVDAFKAELEKSAQPGYQPLAMDSDEDVEGSEYEDLVAELKESASRRRDRSEPTPAQPAAEPAVEPASEPDLEHIDDALDRIEEFAERLEQRDRGFGSGLDRDAERDAERGGPSRGNPPRESRQGDAPPRRQGPPPRRGSERGDGRAGQRPPAPPASVPSKPAAVNPLPDRPAPAASPPPAPAAAPAPVAPKPVAPPPSSGGFGDGIF